MSEKHLVMYSRTWGCPYVNIATGVLHELDITYQEIMIDKDEAALDRVLQWTGYLSVPTLVIAKGDSVLPFEPPVPLPKGHSPRGINRGTMITEPNRHQLINWLLENQFIPA